MLIPSKMNNLIAKYFYDKHITFYKLENGVSEEGGRLKGNRAELISIDCNVQPTSQSLLKERFGIDLDANLMITCSHDEEILKGSFLDYRNIKYEVIEALQYDSHWKILCQSRD